MLKRWAARQRGIRWLIGGIAAVALAAAVSWWLLVPTADWLAHHDVGAAKGTSLQTARDAARGRLLTLGAGLLAAGALLFTARNFRPSREGQVTDRYTKAIEQLGSDKLDVRIGGIYALERIARDSAKDHPTVMESTHRLHPRALTRAVAAAGTELKDEVDHPAGTNPGRRPARERSTRPDVQAAATVVGRRDQKRDIRFIDLAGADLRRADLRRADLAGARWSRAAPVLADLLGAVLHGARWSRAAPVPAGWKLDDSGQLDRAGTGPGPAGAN